MSYEDWLRSHFGLMADGGVWVMPRSGLIVRREGQRLVVVDATDPRAPRELALLRRVASKAGIRVDDD